MATNTPYYELPIPQSTDYVASGYQAIADLGNSVDTLLSQNPLGGFRNKLINGNFDIWQRGTSTFTAPGVYTTDRWTQQFSGGTAALNKLTVTPADMLAAGGPEEIRNGVEIALGGTYSGPGAFYILTQRIENVGTFAGRPVTVSFYARCTSGTKKIGVGWNQAFGSGGSPSAQEFPPGAAVQVNTVWTRYSLTFTLPSINGKTLGTNGDDCLHLNLWLCAGSDFTERSGGVGNQTGEFEITGVQVEGGQKATPVEVRPRQVEIALCQRYFEKSYALATPPGAGPGVYDGVHGHSGSSDNLGQMFTRIHYKTQKRVSAHTVTIYSANTGATGSWDTYFPTSGVQRGVLAIWIADSGFTAYWPTSIANAVGYMNGHWTASAEL